MEMLTPVQELVSIQKRMGRLKETRPQEYRRVKSNLYRRIRVLRRRIAMEDPAYLVTGGRPGKPSGKDQAKIQVLRKMIEFKNQMKSEIEHGTED